MALIATEGRPDDFLDLLRLAYGPGASVASIVRDVRTEWDWLWGTGRFMAVAVRDVASRRTVAYMGALPITETAFQALADDPTPYCNRRLGREPQPGDRPLPTAAETTDGTATLHIAYFAWDATHGADDPAVLRGYVANALLDFHGGYAFRRLSIEVCGDTSVGLATRQGAAIVNDHRAWAEANDVAADARPYLLAIDRDAALATENHWYTRLFRYHPPILGLGDGQRDMLRLARLGMTDVQIAECLSLTPEAVKKRWEAVYGRFYERLPGLLPLETGGKRGVEKRRLVLAHLRDRQEELRP